VLTPQAQTLRASLSEQGVALSAEAVRRGDTIEIGALHAEANGGELVGSGVVRLGAPLAFEGRLQLSKFDPSAFGDYPDGAVNGTFDIAGRLGDAPRADVRWTIADSVLYDLALETSGRARIATRRVSDAQARVKLGEMQLDASGGFGASGDELQFSLEVREISELAAELAGRVRARGTLRGTWQAPQAELSAQAEALQMPGGIVIERATARLAGTPARHGLSLTAHAYDADLVAELRGGLEGRSWRGELVSLGSSGAVELQTVAPTTLFVSRGRAELGRLELTLAKGRVLVRELVKDGERVRSSGEFSGLPTRWLIAAAGSGDRLRSTLLLDGDWTVAATPAVEGTLRVRRAQGDITVLGERPLDLGLRAVALDARFTSAGVAARMDVDARLLSAALGGQISRAPGSGGLGLGRASPILLEGNVELASLSVLAGPYVKQGRVDGRLSADLQAKGTLGEPVFSATLRGEALALDLPLYGVYLRDGALLARLDDNVLRVERFSVRGGQGSFSAKGSLPLRLADGNAKLAWQADQFTVLDRQEMRIVASGNGEVGFDGKKLALTGELRADRGSIEYAADRLPKLADDIVVEGEPRRRIGEAKTSLPIALNLDLDLGSNLTVAMHGFDGKLAGRVNLRTTEQGELRAYGEVRAVAATFFAYGKRLRVDPGIVTFDGPIDNPGLQITAWRRNQAVEAGIQISGTVRAPRVQLVSQPPVPENERLTWLVLGRAPSDTTRADLGLLQAAAGALLARGDVTSMPLDQRLAKTFGLDEISLRTSSSTSSTSTSNVEGAVVAFGKRLSDKVYVSYEQGLGTVASTLVKLDYSISRRWSVRAETGTSSGGGLFYRFSWD
jgi:translocation and assembly module TamB